MKRRILPVLLAAVLLLGILSGCAGKQTQEESVPGSKPAVSTEPGEQQTGAVFAYQPEWLDLDLPFEYINQYAADNTSLYLLGEVMTDPGSGGANAVLEAAAADSTEASDAEQPFVAPTYASQLYRVELATGKTERIDWLKLPQIPEGYEGNVGVDKMQLAKDGSLYIYDTCNSYRYNLPENFDPNTQNQGDYYEEGPRQKHLTHYSADGTVLSAVDLSSMESKEGDYCDLRVIDELGQLYIESNNSFKVLSSEGSPIKTVEFGKNGGSLTAFCGNAAMQSWGENNIFRKIDPQTLEVGEALPMPYNGWNYHACPDGSYDFYYENNGNLYGYKFSDQSSEKVLDWLDCDINSTDINGTVVLPDGRIVGLVREAQNGKSVYRAVILTKVDPATLPQKTVLTLACMYLDYNLRQKIVDFNRRSNTCRIIINDYSQYATESNPQAGLTKLNTEILSGRVPDLIQTDQMPIEQYSAQGILLDLMPFIEKDPEFGANTLVPEIAEAAKVDGKLYQIFPSFTVSTTIALEKVVEEYPVWNLDAVNQAMQKLQPDASIFGVGYTQSQVLDSCVYRNLSKFVNWQTGQCSFDSQDFKDLLTFAKQFPESFDWSNHTWTEDSDGNVAIRNGKQLMMPTTLFSFDDYLWQTISIGEPFRFVGYPSQTGENNAFSLSSGLSITTTCDDPDAAWQLARIVLTPEYQRENRWSGLPSNQKQFDEMLNEAMTVSYRKDENGVEMLDENGEKIVEPKATYYSNNGENVAQIDAMNEQQRDKVLELLRNTKVLSSHDTEISKIVAEEVGAFFAGQRSVDDVAAMVQNRVSLYVAEQK